MAKHSRGLFVSLGLFLACVNHTKAANLVVNGGFETGDFSPWTVASSPPVFFFPGADISVDNSASSAHSGNFSALAITKGSIGAQGYFTASFSQTLATAPGQNYRIDLFAKLLLSASNTLDVFWNGAVVSGSPAFPDNSIGDYQEFTFFAEGAANSTVLKIDITTMNEVHLDDVSVSPLSDGAVVPEPASFSLFAIGMVAMVGFGWRYANNTGPALSGVVRGARSAQVS